MCTNQIIRYLTEHQHEQLEFLEKLVLQSSHSADKQGVDAVGNLLCKALYNCDLTVQRVHQQKIGDNLIFSSSACNTGRPALLLVGHMDTVFAAESSFRCFHHETGKIIGPGIIDMKGGLVCAISLLKALHAQGLLAHIPIRLICNSDEETGSLHSKDLIRTYGKNSLCALVFECGGLQGEIVTGRKGQTTFNIEVHGQAGHAAFTLKNGKASAIKELARMILAIECLNDPGKERVVNVGIIAGGSGVNVVPDLATAAVDSRYTSLAEGTLLKQHISRIVTQCETKGTSASIQILNTCNPMEQSRKNKALYALFLQHATALNIPLCEERRCGVSDANILAECGIPVLDGLGPCGDRDHSSQEYLLTESLLQKTILATVSVIDIWKHDIQFNA